jgi:hypothetical protein
MAIRERNKNIKEGDTGVSKSGNSNDLKNETFLKTNADYDLPDVRSFRAQAIETLNILDSHGINIYDETRTPGMYLNRKQHVASNIIQNILMRENSHGKTNFSDNENPTTTSVSSSLLQALKNQ